MEINSRVLGMSAGEWLIDRLGDPRWTTFRAAIAFLKSSGLKYVAHDLHQFSRRGGTTTKVAVGISAQGTSLEGLQDLWRLLDGHGHLSVVHEGPGGVGSFHPKGYLFTDGRAADLLIGSSNLTEGGLYANHELSIAVSLDLSQARDRQVMAQMQQTLDVWQSPSAHSLPVDAALIQTLHDRGDLPSENAMRVVARAAQAAHRAAGPGTTPPSPFGHSTRVTLPPPKAFPTGLPAAPVTPAPQPSTGTTTPWTATGRPSAATSPRQALYIEVVPHHNGEFFLSMRAIREDPAFFNYPFTGWTTPKQRNNNPYPQLTPDPVVEIIVYDSNRRVYKHKTMHPMNVVEYTRKSEIRLTLPDRLQDDVPAMSVLVMTKDPTPAHDYRLEFYPPGSAPATVTSRLTTHLPSGGAPVARRYGW